jgi:tetratricopeptide (TPR) repeat protein
VAFAPQWVDEVLINLLSRGEEALAAGDSQRAYQLFSQASVQEIPDELLPRLASAFAQAGRLVGRQWETLAWLQARLSTEVSKKSRTCLLQARLSALRHFDTRAAVSLADEALATASEVGDHQAYARILADAAFAAYRQGDPRAASRFAEIAVGRTWPDERSALFALRAQLFAACAEADLERSLLVSREIGRRALALGDVAMAANEENNIAEVHLETGRPAQALASAASAVALAEKAGHLPVVRYGKALMGMAQAETGSLDEAIVLLRRMSLESTSPIQALDILQATAFWLVERKAPGDAEEARTLCELAVEEATRVGVGSRLTTLYANLARAAALVGDADVARRAIGDARRAGETADRMGEFHLALAQADVLSVGDPARSVALNAARARLLRAAAKRNDPRAFCTGVRLHRRLLELSGGVPSDLPGDSSVAVP